jgi:hypothetical protein
MSSSLPFSQDPNGVVSGEVSCVLAWRQEEGMGGDSSELKPGIGYGWCPDTGEGTRGMLE